jgi:hypothetical protein
MLSVALIAYQRGASFGSTFVVICPLWAVMPGSMPRQGLALSRSMYRAVGIPASKALVVMPARIHSSAIHSAVRSSNQLVGIFSASRLSYPGVST